MSEDWTTITVSNRSELRDKLLTLSLMPSSAFRGQSDSEWGLVPGLLRKQSTPVTNEQLLAKEKKLIVDFRQKALRFLGPLESKCIEAYQNGHDTESGRTIALYIMQHYGVATRLLDWTHSIAVALYFACIENEEKDGCIWCFNLKKLEDFLDPRWEGWGVSRRPDRQIEMDQHIYSDSFPHHFVRPDHLLLGFARISAQRGFFTLPSRLDFNCESQIVNQVGARSCIKLIIPKELKTTIVKWLERIGINSTSLQYPGADIVGARLKNSFFKDST